MGALHHGAVLALAEVALVLFLDLLRRFVVVVVVVVIIIVVDFLYIQHTVCVIVVH